VPLSSSARLAISALTGAGSAAALLSVVEGSSSRAFGVAVPSQWVFAGVALILGAGAAWVLLPASAGPMIDATRGRARHCSCGGSVRPDWRLCPHCGELLAEEIEAKETALRSGDVTS